MHGSSLFALALALVVAGASAVSITEYGAVPGDNSVPTCQRNAQAVVWALQNASAAAAAAGGQQQVVTVPATGEFYLWPVYVSNLRWVTFEINGRIVWPKNISTWPNGPDHKGSYQHLFCFTSCSNMVITGNGVIDGQGYDWWVLGMFAKLKHHRGKMLVFEQVNYTEISGGLTFQNSPSFHMDLQDCIGLHIHDITVWVDVFAQKEAMRKAGWLHPLTGLPMFPLNTDGIDPSGRDHLIENVTITNYDDAIAVKPNNRNSLASPCSQNITVRNSRVTHSVGLSIGSVPPGPNTNCVRDITFHDITMHQPIKAIYIKTDPGTVGNGFVEGITYRNIVARESLWYPIWIGPQQQKQPGTAGTGCSFLYPIVDKCPTNPRVPISNVLLQNVTLTGGLTLPGVILCNETKPCTDIVFDNVQNSGVFLVKKDYVCMNAADSKSVGSTPPVPCFSASTSSSSAAHTDRPDLADDVERTLDDELARLTALTRPHA